MNLHPRAGPIFREARWLALAATAVAFAVGCGSVDEQVAASGGGGGAGKGGASASSSTSAGGTGAGGADTGWTACESPGGFAVCSSTLKECPPGAPACGVCPFPSAPISPCLNTAYFAWAQGGILDCPGCKDGGVCIDVGFQGAFLSCQSWDLGALYAANGFGAEVRYEDYGLWTGDPLPEPVTCPDLPGISICGGHCGGCPAGEFCTGRSPLHPYGICAPDKIGYCGGGCSCGAGLGCFIYTVQPAAQTAADRSGMCFPLATCQDMAANLPGGGKCMQ
jgi:hypothetical protein